MIKNTPPINPPWRISDGVIILIIINLFALILRLIGQGWFIFIIEKLPGGPTKINELLIGSTIQTGLFLILIFYYVFIKYQSSLKELGLVKTKLGYWLKVGLINGFILFFAVLFVGILLNLFFPIEIKPQPVAEAIMSARTNWEKLIPFLVVSIFAPVSEELYFRGFLYPALRKKIGIRWAMLVTSLIFGSLHFDLIRMIPLAFGGIWLNWLYERSGSLYTSIMAHSVWNGIMTILIFIVPQGI